MPPGVVSVGVLADFESLIEQSDAAGMSIDAFAGKVVTSARTASRAMADFAKAQGASADEAKAAAATTAAAWDATYGSVSKSSKDAGNAALATSRLFKESADAQTAAYQKAAAAQKELEVQQKAASDAAVAAAAKTASAAEVSAARVTAAGKKLGSIGKWSLFGGAAAVAASVDGAAKLQTAMERLHTQAGVSQQSVTGLTKSVMNMAGGLATSPEALAQSLYHVESGGIHGANALKVMSTAAKEAKVSGADLTDTTTALTATVYSGISGAQNYAKAMGLLNATVGAGDMTFQDLNEALGGPMLATVKGYGLSLKDVGAAMATFGDLNIRGADAATQLRMAVQYMAKPAATAGPILQKLGLSTSSFADAMSKGGLLPALDLLNEKLKAAGVPKNDYAQIISDIFGKKGASGVTILENSLDKLKTKYTEVGKGTNQVNAGWAGWNKTLQADMDHLKATVEELADKFGTSLIPKLTAVAHSAEDVIAWLEKNKTAADDLAKVIGGTLGLAMTVFAYQKAAAFVHGIGDMLAGMGKLALGVAGGAAKVGTSLAGVVTDSAGTATAVAGTNATLIASNAETGSSFTTMATEAGTATTAMEGQMSLFADKVEADNALIESTNRAAGASFTAMIPLIGAVVLAAEAAQGPLNKLSNDAYKATGGVIGTGSSMSYTGKAGAYTAAQGMAVAKKLSGKTGGLDSAQTIYQQMVQAGAIKGTKQATQLAKAAPNVPLPELKGTGTQANPNQMLTYLQRALGITKSQAAGIVGNIGGAEDGTFQANRVQGAGDQTSSSIVSGAGYGLAQWTSSGRQQGLAAMAKQMGLAQDSVKVQEAYIVQELKTGYAGVLKQLKGTSTASQAASVIELGYESPKDPASTAASREAYATALANGKIPGAASSTSTTAATSGSTGTGSWAAFLKSIQNLASGAKLPAVLQTAVATNQSTQLQDQANTAQAVGQAQVTWLQAINQQLQDKGAAIVQKLIDTQAKATDQSASLVTALKDSTQTASDKATAQVTAMKDAQAITDQKSAIQVAAIKNQTTIMQDLSAIQVAAINASATKIADASNAQATLITDNAQTTADTISERGLYGLNLVVQKLQVQADIVKTGFDQQIATAQAALDNDQSAANVANAQAQLLTDQITATQNLKVLQAQQNLNMVTLREDAAEAKSLQHLDAVTAKEDMLEAIAKIHTDSITITQDARANSARAHLDAVTIVQDSRILKATQHADAVQLAVDTSKIGPAQIAVDMNANSSKTVQQEMQNQLNLATASGDKDVNAANLQLANVTSSANKTIAGAENAYQSVQNSVNTAIQTATSQSASVTEAGNKAIQIATTQNTLVDNTATKAITAATDTYQSAQDAANTAIANATQSQAQLAANWANQIAGDQGNLSTIQGKAAVGEASAQGSVTTESAAASTQFAGSGLVVNVYGDTADPNEIGTAVSWAIRTNSI